mgnify:CR=1 FL=1
MAIAWQARADDAALLARMLHDFNVEFEDPSPGVGVLTSRVAAFIAGDVKTYLLGGLKAGEPVGFAQIDFTAAVWCEGPIAHLGELYVMPAERGKGVGRALMAAILELARARGADGAEVVTGEGDIEARRLYESFGFENQIEGPAKARALFYELNLG